MKKIFATLLLFVVCICSVFGLVVCGGNSNDNSNPNPTPTPTPAPTPTPPDPLPTAAEIVAARKAVTSQKVQGYDFNLTLTGDFGVMGLAPSLSGKYDGLYRYDGNTDELSFKRTTSGALLADSTCYLFTSGDNRIKVTMDGNAVKKLSVEVPEDQNITMVNLPVVAIVDAIGESNISNITELKNSDYKYSCQIAMDQNGTVHKALSKVFEKLGTGVSFKGIDLAGNVGTLDFLLKDGKLNDFHLKFQLQIGTSATKIALTVDYAQKGSSIAITLPNTTTSGILYQTADVQREVGVINAAIDDLKNDPVYSLDLIAKNEFDPGWNKLAIVDSYTARMYKNTVDGVDWFNHSYFYKAHSEASGKETYKYTIGNVNGTDEANQGTWLISRKSTNTQTKLQNVTADTQFDFLTSMIKQQASGIDCIKKQTNGKTVTYTVYLGKAATQSVQKKIVDMINTNDYDDVIAVNNYFNTENIVKDASIQIVLEDGKVSSVVCDTELTYSPTGGDYTEYNITLNNTIELQVNKDLAKAQKYAAPDKVKGNMIGWGKNLNDSEYYIL